MREDVIWGKRRKPCGARTGLFGDLIVDLVTVGEEPT